MQRTFRLIIASLCLGACGSDNGSPSPDAPIPDAPLSIDARPPDAPPPATTIEELPITETKALAGLSDAVEVVRDNRGTPHIYAHNLADAVRVQGYLMARDRFIQMEFIRRSTLGTLAEIFYAVNAGSQGADEDARFIGYNREGQAIYDSIAPTDPTRVIADAFVAGVNVYIHEIKAATDKTPYTPAGTALVALLLFNSPNFTDWQPSDVFAMARFQATNLSYDPDSEILRTKALAGVLANLDTAHQGAFPDLFSEIQGRRVYTLPGFPSKPASPSAARPAPPRLPAMSTLDAALGYLGRQHNVSERFEGRGSNNWVVGGSKTLSGSSMLANDPHLSLVSPPVWWYVHLNTKRFGGVDGVNVNGVAFASLPGVVLGFNQDLAWGATVTGFDVTDVYNETVTEGATPTVLFNGNQVAIQTIHETIKRAGTTDADYPIEIVPHHGPILPGTHANGAALSVRYTGHTPSNELAYFTSLAGAKTVDDAWAAQASFRVGSQNFVVISKDEISWNTESRVPIRDPRALTWSIAANGTISGYCPTFVLPGTGEYEWTGDLPSNMIPKDRNPTKGFIATANQDSVGVTDDGNPCNQANNYYLGGGFADGYREGRIVQRLTTLTTRGNMTPADMMAVQKETESQLGDTLRDPLVAILAADIDAGNTLFTAEEKATLTEARNRIMSWSRQTPHGVGATDPDEIADSIATTIFNVGITRIIPLAFGDEYTAIGLTPGQMPTDRAGILLERALTDPASLYTYDAGLQDTILWDDVSTTTTTETKGEIVGRGFLAAMAYLHTRLGDDISQWRWGRIHTVRFNALNSAIATTAIPPPGDSVYPDGFPRHGDYGAVDVGNYGLFNTTSFMHTSGSSQRLVVEMLPTGPKAYNALPGGQTFDTGPHHDDEARMYWINNLAPPVNFVELDVVQHSEARLRFTP
jgi:penicillin amidase